MTSTQSSRPAPASGPAVEAITYRASDRPAPTRLPFLMAVGLVLLAAGAALAWYLTRSATVELSIDGRSQSLQTRADTVGDLLADQQLSVTGNDLVEPPVETELVDGTAVTVRHARPLTVSVDGVEATHQTTELTVGAALAAIGAPTEGAAVSLPLNQDLPRGGASVVIITPKPVTIDDGGRTRMVTSTEASVADLLAARNLSIGDLDKLTPSPGAPVTADMTVTITRIRIATDIRSEVIAHDTMEQSDANLTVGTRTTATDGVDGRQDVTYEQTFTNGELTSEEAVETVVVTEPVTEVVRVGTKPVPVQPAADPGAPAGGAAADLNWAALAECESSGNPKAVNPAGYYGLYQFSLRTWASVGGSGNPVDASVAEQTERAQILYNKAGAGQWPHCGKYLFS